MKELESFGQGVEKASNVKVKTVCGDCFFSSLRYWTGGP